jgi:hypothetical protein
MTKEQKFQELLLSYLKLTNLVIEDGNDKILSLKVIVEMLTDDLSAFRSDELY